MSAENRKQPTTPAIFVAGGAHVDRRGQVSGVYVAGASNPGRLREEIGGGAFNAACSVAQRGVEVSFMSVRGGDIAGAGVAEAIARAGLADLSAVFLDRATPSYTALIASDGSLVAGLADMELYELAFARQLARRKLRDAIASADAVLLDANLPEPAIERLLSQVKGGKAFAIAISPAKVVRLRPFLHRLDLVFMSLREARALSSAEADAGAGECARRLAALGLAAAVITDGAKPVTLLQNGGTETFQPPPLAAMVDETGAGDALAGVTIAAIMLGRPLEHAIEEGLAAARITIASATAVPDLAPAAFSAALAAIKEHRRTPADE